MSGGLLQREYTRHWSHLAASGDTLCHIMIFCIHRGRIIWWTIFTDILNWGEWRYDCISRFFCRRRDRMFCILTGHSISGKASMLPPWKNRQSAGQGGQKIFWEAPERLSIDMICPHNMRDWNTKGLRTIWASGLILSASAGLSTLWPDLWKSSRR